MKKLKLLAAILFALGAAVVVTTETGCTTTQQQVTYNSLYSLEQSVVAANDSYQTLVIKGALPTNSVPQVSAKYNQFQAAFVVALDAVQFNTNAIAPASLQVEAQDLINLISSIKNGGVK